MEFDEKELIEQLKKNFILNIWFLYGLKNRQVTVAKRLLEPLKSCDLWGVLKEELVGFIGLHQEESMGMLEVFPEYRRIRKIRRDYE